MRYIKRTSLLIITCMLICGIWFDKVVVQANSTEKATAIITVAPERAVFCAIGAALLGILAYAWRHRKTYS